MPKKKNKKKEAKKKRKRKEKQKLTNPPVANLRSKQATTDPSNCAIQYKMALSSVMFPPTKAPKVTAGFTCPPEMFAPTETATKSASAWAKAAATRPEGVVGPPSVSLPARTTQRVQCLICADFVYLQNQRLKPSLQDQRILVIIQ